MSQINDKHIYNNMDDDKRTSQCRLEPEKMHANYSGQIAKAKSTWNDEGDKISQLINAIYDAYSEGGNKVQPSAYSFVLSTSFCCDIK